MTGCVTGCEPSVILASAENHYYIYTLMTDDIYFIDKSIYIGIYVITRG